MKKSLLFSVFIVSACALSDTHRIARAQQIVVSQNNFFGSDTFDFISAATPAPRGGLMFAGNTIGVGNGHIPMHSFLDYPLWVVQLDSNAQIARSKVYASDAIARGICTTADGGSAVVYTDGGGNYIPPDRIGIYDVRLLRLDPQGNVKWKKVYGTTDGDYPQHVIATPDNGFLILANTQGHDSDAAFHYGSYLKSDWLLIKVDSNGERQWRRTLGGSGDEDYWGGRLLPAPDGGYYMIGHSASRDGDCSLADTTWHTGIFTRQDIYIFRLDSFGNTLWVKSYGGDGYDYIYDALWDSRDSSIVFVGSSTSGTTSVNTSQLSGNHGGPHQLHTISPYDMYAIKVDKNGNFIWGRLYGDIGDDIGRAICLRRDGGYILVSTSLQYPLNSLIGMRVWVFAVGTNGVEITNKSFGNTSAYETVASVVPYRGGYAILGDTPCLPFDEGGGTFKGRIDGYLTQLEFWPLGISETLPQKTDGLRVIPNPAHGTVRVFVPKAAQGKGLLQIMDAQGRVQLQQSFASGASISIESNTLAPGTYTIQWKQQGGKLLASRFVIR